ncbi:phasin family protein [Methylorubrum sp. SL192]|uniref:phasin family protein n=1 Tax=Methylorubrum sp. SL192 TaxID=2995167 RepID=UPI0022758944|nr:phasin family protein [Methylorubrum sp. SL192]MCY1641926.1 phasin family protein [Methylorubrum sp. SL192]
MSSSRRRGRPPGASATTQPPTVTATPAEVADALLAETPADKGPEPETDEPETAEVQAVEAAEQPADDAAAEAVEASGEPAPAETQSAADDQPADSPEETVTAVSEEAPALSVEPEIVASDAAATVETATEALAQTAPLPAPAEANPEAKSSDDARSKTHSVRFGANFAFAPTLAPLTEINAKLFAFARGEGEAVLAHFQALAQAKSPAEAIRLQVTEMQRAADASLSCFSEIVRSANRLHDTARRH